MEEERQKLHMAACSFFPALCQQGIRMSILCLHKVNLAWPLQNKCTMKLGGRL